MLPTASAHSDWCLDGRGRRRAQPRIGEAITPRRGLPWLLIALVATGLEGIGLALGGESASVPTLSTVIDHVLAWHLVRMVILLLVADRIDTSYPSNPWLRLTELTCSSRSSG